MVLLHHLILLLISGLIPSNQQIDPPTTAEALWQSHPERIRSLFDDLDFTNSDLSKVQKSLQQGDTLEAAQELVAHFKMVERNWVVSTLDPLVDEEANTIATRLENDSVEFNGVAGKVPQTSNGSWQWDYTGPEQDDEFGYSLNGHRYLAALYIADPSQYAKIFNDVINDWVIHHPLPPIQDSVYLVLNNQLGLDYRDIGEVQWRTLEAGRRLGAVWPQLFHGFQHSNEFDEATRLLMLSSMAEQADFLMQYHKRGHNWTTMEMNGLALVGLAFPEFKRANEWANYALDVMSQEIQRQVYPDGVQTELSTKTQWVALNRFESIANNFRQAGREISNKYVSRLEEMYNYLAYSMRPDGHQPLNNDSDREDLRDRVLSAADNFNRPDWKWVATNGQQGQLPDSMPTITFPWAGIHVMRNGWGEEAHWAFFDAGPFGTGHQHADKLHLSISAYGKDLLVDGGRYTHQNYFSFDPSEWRGYFRSSFSHNVILVDGNGQQGGRVITDKPQLAGKDFFHHPEYDYARGKFTDGYVDTEGIAEHQRSLMYLRDQCWIVLDHFKTDRPRKLEVLWHFAPTCQVSFEGDNSITSNEDEGNLRIIPLGNINWGKKIISGQEEPVIQGWYSANYGEKIANATVVYSTEIEQSITFAWLLIPENGQVPSFETSFKQLDDQIEINIGNKEQETVVQLPINEGLPLVRLND